MSLIMIMIYIDEILDLYMFYGMWNKEVHMTYPVIQKYDKWSLFMHILICYMHIPILSKCYILTILLYITKTVGSGHWI